MRSNKGKLAIGAALAAGTGYIAGILTAPKSGRATRRDLAKNASRAKTEGEKQLKKLHSELNDLLDQANDQKKKLSDKTSKEMQRAAEKAKIAKEKARLLLSALHDGDADDPNLKEAIKEAKKAKADLLKFLSK